MEEVNSIKSIFELGSLIVSFIFLLWIVKFMITKLSEQISEIREDVKKILYTIERGGKNENSNSDRA